MSHSPALNRFGASIRLAQISQYFYCSGETRTGQSLLHKHRIVGKDKFSRSAGCNLCNTAQEAADLCFFLAAALLTHVQLAVHHDLQSLFRRVVYQTVGPQPVLVWAVTLYPMQGFAFVLVELYGVLVSFLPVPINFIPVLINLSFKRWYSVLMMTLAGSFNTVAYIPSDPMDLCAYVVIE